jgi:septin family protein
VARSPLDEASPPQTSSTKNFTSHYLETEIDGERVGLTLWDSEGLEKNVVDLQLRDMSSFLESKFEDTFAEERKVVRAPGVRDTHIHCVFLILDPVRLDANIAAAEKTLNGNTPNGKFGNSSRLLGGLDEDLDLQVFRTMLGKTTVVPVISKADTITTAHMAFLKKTVWESLKKANLDPLEILGLDDQDDVDGDSGIVDKFDEREEDEAAARELEDTGDLSPHTSDSDTVPSSASLKPRPTRTSSHKRISSSSSIPIVDTNGTEMPYLPLSIISPDPHSLATAAPGEKIGRQFPWGFADPYNVEHCDFLRLKESVFSEWRGELREASREVWYERWRTSRLNGAGGNGAKKGDSKRMR